MSKNTAVKLFIGSAIGAIAGSIVATAALWVAYANNAFVVRGWDVTGVQPTASAWAMTAVFFLATLITVAGIIGLLVSWIGALRNTLQFEDKTWFVLLLLLGLFSFGVVAMIAYAIGGPNESGTPARTPHASV